MPILHGPNWDLNFHIYTDVFGRYFGVVLRQKKVVELYTNYYINNNIFDIELNCITH
jgi:hypothetical protein